MHLQVFDFNLNRLGIIDAYDRCDFEESYEKDSSMLLTVEGNSHNAKLLISEEKRIISRSDDIHRGFIIESVEFNDDKSSSITIFGRSLSQMIGWRSVGTQQRFTGNIETVLKSFVNINCIAPVNSNRIIPNLVLGVDYGIDETVDITLNGQNLGEKLWEICKSYEISYEVLIDYTNKKFVFSTYKGLDRSSTQNVNSQVIFSKTFENVNSQSYLDDTTNVKTTALIVGEGEGVNLKTAIVGDEFSGIERREVYIEAKDIRQSYTDENSQEIVLTDAEYEQALKNRGDSRLTDFKRIQAFESEIDLNTQFKYKQHYWLGDKVTNRNDDLGIVTHSRVVKAFETFDRRGYNLRLEFGTSIPNFIDKIKREVK